LGELRAIVRVAVIPSNSSTVASRRIEVYPLTRRGSEPEVAGSNPAPAAKKIHGIPACVERFLAFGVGRPGDTLCPIGRVPGRGVFSRHPLPR
jgi:hypothetical protein